MQGGIPTPCLETRKIGKKIGWSWGKISSLTELYIIYTPEEFELKNYIMLLKFVCNEDDNPKARHANGDSPPM